MRLPTLLLTLVPVRRFDGCRRRRGTQRPVGMPFAVNRCTLLLFQGHDVPFSGIKHHVQGYLRHIYHSRADR